MSKLILDVMGGDFGPGTMLEGACLAVEELSKKAGELVLVGDREIIVDHLKKNSADIYSQFCDDQSSFRGKKFSIKIHHANEAIEMVDSIRAVRSKPNASLNIGCQLAAESYRTDRSNPAAFVSAGHSGAVMASSLLQMGRLTQVERPAIAVVLPTVVEHGCVVLDVGANVDCSPQHLRDFAVMGALFAQRGRDYSSKRGLPKVGLLSNGEEKKKGTEVTRAAYSLIEKAPCFLPGANAVGEFLGYVEGKEIFNGLVDVVVTDGFVGNVVLKALEGLGSAVESLLLNEAKKSWLAPLGFLLSRGVFRTLKRKLDYAETGAAPLLGVSGYVFICHGRSSPKAIKNALFRAHSSVENQIVQRLEKALEQFEV